MPSCATTARTRWEYLESISPLSQPAVFISCVSPEFRQTRSRVAHILTRLGYTPVIQEIFGTEPGDLRQVLRDKINACDSLTPNLSSSTPDRRRKRRGSYSPATVVRATRR